ncbi:MAG: 16S rRNA (uracil(1498)-N(3))-methyltransferase [Calditrichaeota bacterium]|nr:MAG: 16S rRNA (uracil(1498)-N(3))-methyltransferase [Calditrichota bacterium]
MPQELFYAPELQPTSSEVLLPPEESYHLQRVLRRRRGAGIGLTNGAGLLASAIVEEQRGKQVRCTVQEIQALAPPAEQRITVALATIRPNRMDWAVEKLTEMGVGHIQWLHTEYTAVHAFKERHLQNIAISAMKQSRQAYLPRMYPPMEFADWLQNAASPGHNSVALLAHPSESAITVREIDWNGSQPVCIAVGPEGGFAPAEVEQARAIGFCSVRLAGQILRAETAAVTAVAQLKLKIL